MFDFDSGEAENDFMISTLESAMRERMDAIPPAERNAETMAKAAHEAIRSICEQAGMNPDIECMIRAPGEEAYDGAGYRWLVCWESGPFEWAIPISLRLPYGLMEPYYSFDLSFYPSETYS